MFIVLALTLVVFQVAKPIAERVTSEGDSAILEVAQLFRHGYEWISVRRGDHVRAETYKAQVARVTIRTEALAEIAANYKVHPNLVTAWTAQVPENLAALASPSSPLRVA